MKLSIIAPVYDLDLTTKLSDLYMVLGWTLKECPDYVNFYRDNKKQNPKSFYILDNGVNEGKVVKSQDLINLAIEHNMDEIVLPDVLDQSYRTLELSFNFIAENRAKLYDNNIRTMGVIQGDTPTLFLECFNNFAQYQDTENINTIGIGYRNLLKPFISEMGKMTHDEWEKMGIYDIDVLAKHLEDNTFYYTLSRLYFIRKYVNFDQLAKTNRVIHLLGLWNPAELKYYKHVFTKEERKYIRSCDSAALCQAAQSNIIFNKDYGVVNKPKAMLDFYDKMNVQQIMTFYNNLEILKEWTK